MLSLGIVIEQRLKVAGKAVEAVSAEATLYCKLVADLILTTPWLNLTRASVFRSSGANIVHYGAHSLLRDKLITWP